MIARYSGRCGLCQQGFDPGDEIDEVDGEWCHSACGDEDTDEEYEA